MCVCVCPVCPVMDWCPPMGAFLHLLHELSGQNQALTWPWWRSEGGWIKMKTTGLPSSATHTNKSRWIIEQNSLEEIWTSLILHVHHISASSAALHISSISKETLCGKFLWKGQHNWLWLLSVCPTKWKLWLRVWSPARLQYKSVQHSHPTSHQRPNLWLSPRRNVAFKETGDWLMFCRGGGGGWGEAMGGDAAGWLK